MAVGVGEAIEEDNRPLVSVKKQAVFVVGSSARWIKDTSLGLGRFTQNMFHPPWCPKGFHRLGGISRIVPTKVSPASRMA